MHVYFRPCSPNYDVMRLFPPFPSFATDIPSQVKGSRQPPPVCLLAILVRLRLQLLPYLNLLLSALLLPFLSLLFPLLPSPSLLSTANSLLLIALDPIHTGTAPAPFHCRYSCFCCSRFLSFLVPLGHFCHYIPVALRSRQPHFLHRSCHTTAMHCLICNVILKSPL
jgi:hypothetical protein